MVLFLHPDNAMGMTHIAHTAQKNRPNFLWLKGFQVLNNGTKSTVSNPANSGENEMKRARNEIVVETTSTGGFQPAASQLEKLPSFWRLKSYENYQFHLKICHIKRIAILQTAILCYLCL